LLYTAILQDHPVAVRYPRGSGVGVAVQREMTAIPFGKGEIRREMARSAGQGGKRIAMLAFGTLLYPALEAGERLDATVANMRFVKPLDLDLVAELARSHDAIVTIEEGSVMGGAGSAVMEALNAAGIQVPVLALGLPDEFVEHGDPAKLLSLCGLDAAGIEQSVLKRFGARPALVRPAVNH
jgi:1-deoxy-D-xylulose-5-phosphate synthase